MIYDKKATIEALRVFILGIVAYLITVLSSGQTIDYRALMVAGVLAVLRYIDKFLHESGIAEKGLTRF